jgi:hypothetical protein
MTGNDQEPVDEARVRVTADGTTSYDVATERYRVSLQPAPEGVSFELIAAIWIAMDKAATRLGFRNYAAADGYWHFERPAEAPNRVIGSRS